MALPPGGGRSTCENCRSIDVREWFRRGYLRPGQRFSWSWSHGGEPCGSITVRTEPEAVPGAVVLSFRSRDSSGNLWRSVEQCVPITWTECHLGGWRPWFRCTPAADGSQSSMTAPATSLHAGIAAAEHYGSRQLTPRDRVISRARKFRMQLGGHPSLFVREDGLRRAW